MQHRQSHLNRKTRTNGPNGLTSIAEFIGAVKLVISNWHPPEVLTDLFKEAKNKNTHIIVERIVADIDDIVKKVRFPDWQHTTQGERLVQKELRRTLVKLNLRQVD